MAKTKAQLITDIRQIIAQTDANNSNFNDAQLLIWLNDAYRRVVIATRNFPYNSRDYTAAASVTLNAATLTINNAKLKNPSNSNKYESLKIINLEELLKLDPDYEAATANIPQFLIHTAPLTAVMYPPPTTAVINLTTPLRCYGAEMPTELSADGDTPTLPPNLHDILAFYPAFRCFSFLGDEPRATQQLTLFRGALKDEKEASTEFSRALKRWRWEERL